MKEVNRNELFEAMAELITEEKNAGPPRSTDPYHLSDEIHDMFRLRGWVVMDRNAPEEATTGRHSAPPPPVDEPLTGAAADRVRDRIRRNLDDVQGYLDRYSVGSEGITEQRSGRWAVTEPEISRDRIGPPKPDTRPAASCRGCSGTCCTGEGSEACTCAEEQRPWTH